MRTRFSRLAAVTIAATLSLAAFAGPAQTAGGTETVSGSGVGAVKVGKTYEQLRKQGLIGSLRRGCEFGGPNTRSAKLLKPLKGSVDFTLSSPRKVASIIVTAGGSARGVGIGDTLKDVKAAFKKAKVDRSTEEVFRITLV